MLAITLIYLKWERMAPCIRTRKSPRLGGSSSAWNKNWSKVLVQSMVSLNSSALLVRKNCLGSLLQMSSCIILWHSIGSTPPARWLNVSTTGLQSLESTKCYKKDWNDDAMLMTSISLQSLLIKSRSQHSNIDSDGSRPTPTGLQSLKSTKRYEKDQNNDAMPMTSISLQSLLIKWRSQHSNINSNGSRPTKTTNVLMRISTFGAIWTVMLINLLRSSMNEWIDTGKVKPIEEGFFIKWMAVSVTVDCKRITSHVLHKICLHIQGWKQQQYLQDKQSWDDNVWQSLNWRALSPLTCLSLGTLRWIKLPRVFMGGSILVARNPRSLLMLLTLTSVPTGSGVQ